MVSELVRVEAKVPQSTKDWLELESIRTDTPQHTIIGNAISEYKSTTDKTNVGSQVFKMGVSAKKMDFLVSNLDELSNNMSNSYVKIRKLVQFVSFSLEKSTKNHKKIDQTYEEGYRMKVIEDCIDNITDIKECNPLAYNEYIDILFRSVKGRDKEYILELSKENRKIGTTYISNTLDDCSIYSEISELAANCMTVGLQDRNIKIERAKEYISDHYAQNDISDLITIFQNEIEKVEAKK